MLTREAPVAVIGAGLMGHGIAGVLTAAGHPVRLHDPDPATLQRAPGRLRDAGADEQALDRLTLHDDLEAAADSAQLVVEAAPERLELKQDLFARLDALLPDAVLASNTSVLSITAIAERVGRPERVVGTHWWNPPALVPLVEVVSTAQTSEDTVQTTVALLREAGKVPVRVHRDVPGFVGNRLQHALWREALALVADGVCDADTVDLVVSNGFGLRLAAMGPLENADYVGLDLTLAIHDYLLPHLDASPHPSPLLRDLVAAGHLGAKTGQGLQSWPPGRYQEATERLAEHLRTATATTTGTAALSHLSQPA